MVSEALSNASAILELKYGRRSSVHKGNHAMNRARLSFEASRKTIPNQFVGAAYYKNPGKI